MKKSLLLGSVILIAMCVYGQKVKTSSSKPKPSNKKCTSVKTTKKSLVIKHFSPNQKKIDSIQNYELKKQLESERHKK